jgi:hypothetical protein
MVKYKTRRGLSFICEVCNKKFSYKRSKAKEWLKQDWGYGMGAPLCNKHLKKND